VGTKFALGVVTAKIHELAQTMLKLKQNPLLKALLKLKKHELKQLDQEKSALQLYTPLEGRSDFDGTERFDAFTKVVAFLKDASCRCLLLMGDAGAGKTTFSYFLAQSLWKAHEKGFVGDQPIPVLIPLITIGDVEKNLLTEHFRNRGLDPEETLLLKKNFSFVLILEGYDERNVFKNLYATNGLDQWNCKVITSCRSQALLNRQDNYRPFFAPTQGLLDEIILCPFTEMNIKKYLEEFVKNHKDEIGSDNEVYWKTLSRLPSVLALVSNPFVLSMTVLALPDLLKKYQWEELSAEEKSSYDKMTLTQAELYDLFVDSWFERQIKKSRINLKLKDGTLLTKEDFLKFNEEIATAMIGHKTKYLEVQKIKQSKQTSKLFSSRSVDPKAEDWQYRFFDPDNEKATLLRSGWMLKQVGAHSYTFLHDSLRAHFGAKQLFHGILARSSFALGHPLNEELIIEQPDLISPLVDRVKKDPSLEKMLFELLESSKHEPFSAIGAANAITILNRAGICFNNRDLSRVRIQGADLSGGFFTQVNFSEADLRNVRFIEPCLNLVNFTGACMDDIQFEQYLLLHLENEVSCFKYAPNGQWLAIGDRKGNVHIYDTAKGHKVKTLENPILDKVSALSIEGLNFSQDGLHLTVIDTNHGIQLWQLDASKLVSSSIKIKGDNISFSPDGKIIASSERDYTVHLWDSSSGNELCIFNGHTRYVLSISFSPDGQTLASGSQDRTIRIWDISSGKELHTLQHKDEVSSICFSPDGKILASVSGNGFMTIQLWDISTGKELSTLKEYEPSVHCVRFSPDGKTIAWETSSFDRGQTIHLCEVASGRELHGLHCDLPRRKRTYLDHSFSFSPNGKTLTSRIDHQTISLWDLSYRKGLCVWGGHKSSISSISYSPDGKIIASGSSDHTIRLWDALSKKVLRSFEGHTRDITSISFSPDSKTLVSASKDMAIRTWEVASGKELLKYQDSKCDGFVTIAVLTDPCVGFSPNGKVFASTNWYQSAVHLRDVTTGKIIQSFTGNSGIGEAGITAQFSFSPDGKTLAVADKFTIRLYDILSGEEIRNYQGHTKPLRKITFSADGKIIAAASQDTTVRLWDVSSAKELYTLKGHTESVGSISFSPDNRTIASGSSDGSVRLWDVSSGQCLHILTGGENSVLTVGWDPTGQWLITGGLGGIRQYQIPRDLKNNRPLLFWSSHREQGLHCVQTTITQVSGLSPNNLKLFENNFSTGQVSQKPSEDILFARDQMETVGDSCKTVFGRLSKDKLINLTHDSWVVSLAHKKKNEHAFLILEGIENKKRVIYQAEVFLDYERKNHTYNVPLYGELGFGYAYVQIKPMTKINAEELAKQCFFRSESISKTKVDQLLERIRKDAGDHELLYSNPGKSKLYAIAFYNTEYGVGKEYGNCLTFAEKWLKEADIKFVNEKGWQSTLLPFDMTSNRSYLQPVISSLPKKEILKIEKIVVPDVPFDLDQMETVGDSCETVFGCLTSGDPLGLTTKHWVISLAQMKGDDHAFLILEGIENKKRVIYRAEVIFDTKLKKDERHMSGQRNRSGFGYAQAQIKPISTQNAEQLVKLCRFRSESIIKTQATLLLELIRKDAEGELIYNENGSSKIYAIVLGVKEYGNSLTFAEKWLKKVNVQFVNEKGWEETVASSDTIHERTYLIAKDEKEKSCCNCVVQ